MSASSGTSASGPRLRRLLIGVLLLILAAASFLGLGPASAQQLNIPDSGPGRLRAARVRYDARTQTFHAEGNVRLAIGELVVEAPRLSVDQRRRTVQATGGVVVRQPDAVLRAQALRYEIGPRIAHVSGEVRLDQEGTALTAGRMTLEVGPQIVRAREGVRLVREGSTVTGEAMVAELKRRVVEVSGRAVLVRPAAPAPSTQDRAAQTLANRDTRIAAERMRFRWDANEAEAQGGVVVTQPDKTVKASTVVYSEARGVAEFAGDVEVEQRSGEWLVESGVARPPQDPGAAKTVKSPVHLKADRLVVRIETRDMEAEGRVRVEQEGRLATGDRAAYSERAQTIIVTGNVRLREADGSWLRADRVVIAIADETFEATGNVETEFTVTRGK